MSNAVACPDQTTPTGPAVRWNRFLASHWLWVVGAIVLSGVAVRTVYFWQANDGPLVRMHEWDQSDMGYYDRWARTILDGDPLCKTLWPPFHYWHGVIASSWLKKNPELREQLQAEAREMGPDITPERLLWRNWMGPERFYQEPGYPYLIALTYLVCGRHPVWVMLWQLGLGVVSALLVWRITRRHFGDTAAAVAGLMAATCSPTICYEMLLLRDSLLVFMGLLLVELTDTALARKRLRWWLLLGAALGFALAIKAIFNLYLAGLLGLVILDSWSQWKQMGARAAVIVVGMFLMLSPIIVRNLVVGVSPFALAGNAGFAFIQNNAPDYRWIYANLVAEEYFPDLAGKTGGQLFPAMIATWRAHPNLWSIVWMYCCKFDAAWHWWERPDNISSYFYELYAPILRWLPVDFTIISPLALVGLALALRDFRRQKVLYLLVVVTLVPMLLFNVLGRFRLPMIVAVLPFAGMTVAQAVAWFSERRWWRAGLTTLAVGLVALGTARPVPDLICLARRCDFTATFGFYYRLPLADALNGFRWREAIRVLDDFCRHEPPALRYAKAGDHIKYDQAELQQVALLFAELNRHCAGLELLCGDRDAGEAHLNRSLFLQRFAQYVPPKNQKYTP